MKKYIIKTIILLMGLSLGIAISYQVRNNLGENEFVSLNTIQSMKNEVSKNKSEIEEVKNLIEDKKEKLKEFENATNTSDVIEVLNKEIKNIKTISGFVDLEGPGIIVKIQDSDEKFIPGQSNPGGIVHDADIQNILNDLKVAGAEAISITGQRVILNSPIRCGGPVIRVNNKNLVAPFIIKAIGNSKKLYASLDAPGTYGRYLKDNRDLQIDISTREYLVVPRYWNDLDINYMKPIREGE